MEEEGRYERAIELVDGMSPEERLRFYGWLTVRMNWHGAPKVELKEERVERYVAAMNDIIGDDIRRRTRRREVVTGRNIVMHRLVAEGAKTEWVGKVFGMKHCAVIYARRSVEDMLLMPRAYIDEMTVYRMFNDKIKVKDENDF